ncbi:MAG: metal-dependent hydrolase [Chloroflexi bacterium]|nr:metal-dependent hydrolase [Chloroflexota bacterium]
MASAKQRQTFIVKTQLLPSQIETLTAGLSAGQLTTHYLDGEWSVAQNVHHLADSHMNSYIRCKLIASATRPLLKPYGQDIWAKFPDASSADIRSSLALLRSLHGRWVHFWNELPDEAWQRIGIHPESGEVTLDDQLRLYAEHGEAHIDQINRTLAAQVEE